MRAYLTLSRVRLLVAASVILLAPLVAHWMPSSPLRGQEEDGDPVANEETMPGCKSNGFCSFHCDNFPPPDCPEKFEHLSTCSRDSRAQCVKCVCAEKSGTPPICNCMLPKP